MFERPRHLGLFPLLGAADCCIITCKCFGLWLLSLHHLFLVVGQRCQGVTFKKLRGLLDMGQHISLVLLPLTLSHSHCTNHQKISTVTWGQTYTGLHRCPGALSSSSKSEIPKSHMINQKVKTYANFAANISPMWNNDVILITQ